MLPPGGMPNMPGMDPEKMKEMQAAYQEAMKNPETAKKIQEQMKQMQHDEQPDGAATNASDAKYGAKRRHAEKNRRIER